MSENGARRRPRVLSPETKWEIFLEVTSREMTQADAAREWQVDVSTVIGIRRAVKDAALAALATRRGRPAKERNWELERARCEVDQLTERSRPRPSSSRCCGEKSAGAERCAAGSGALWDQGADPGAGRRRRARRRGARVGVFAGRRGRLSALGPARGPYRGHGAMGPLCQQQGCLTPHRLGHPGDVMLSAEAKPRTTLHLGVC